MKVDFRRKDLIDALAVVMPVVPSKSPLPALSSILIRTHEDEVEIIGTDLDICVSAKVKATVEEKGEITLEAKKFYALCRQIKEDIISLEGTTTPVIRAGTGTYEIPGAPVEDFPELILIENPIGSFETEADILRRSSQKTSFAAAKDSTESIFKAILMHIKGKELRFVATDAHKLALIKKYEMDFESEQKFLLPNKFWKEVTKLTGDVSVFYDDTKISFATEDCAITTRLVEGEYPDYESVIPVDNDKVLTVSRPLLESALRRGMIFAHEESKMCILSLSSDVLKVSVQGEGSAVEEIPCEYQGEEMEIGYNISYLLEILTHIDSEEVQFFLKDPISAAIIKPVYQREAEELMYLLMPIRLE